MIDDETECPLPSALTTVEVQRYTEGLIEPWIADQVASEVPVAIMFNGISHAVMMCTPQDLVELGLGFALSEGIIDSRADCYDIEVIAVDARASDSISIDTIAAVPACEVRMEIASRCFVRLKKRRRTLAGSTGCGVCGIDNLQGLDLQPQRISLPSWLNGFMPEPIFKALASMSAQQPLNAASGAVHAAAWAGLDGSILSVYEDVGRHNALDKLLGTRALQAERWPNDGFVVMSSRASYELVRKCARVNIPLLATISAPTSLAIRLAEQAGLQLWGLCREPRALRYTRD